MDEWTFEPYNPALAPEAVALWNRSPGLGDRFPLGERLWRQNVDDDPEYRPGDGLLARDGQGAPAGFVLTRSFRSHAAWPDMAATRGLGWVNAIVVGPAWRGRGLGSRLLALAEERLRREGAERAEPFAGVGHFLPGPPAGDPGALRFWARHGYEPARQVHDLRLALRSWQPGRTPGALLRGDVRIAPMRRGEEGALVDFLAWAFPGRWRYVVATALARGGAPEDILLVTDRAGRIGGFLCLWPPDGPLRGPGSYWPGTDGDRVGGIGPLGLAASLRGGGLGRALLEGAVATLRERGAEACVVDWTDLTDFYGRLGFATVRSYWRCREKPLRPEAVGAGDGGDR